MSLTILSSLTELPGVEWYSLQVDATAQERSVWPVPLHDFTSEFSSFEQTGQFLQALDLIITVDTAVCHLAGALGRKTWVLLPHTPDWRWRLTTNKSLWYPTMSLYRQPTWGDWNTPVQALAKDLETFSTSHIQS